MTLTLLAGLTTLTAQHGHLNAGADPDQLNPYNNPAVGSPLFFVNGSSWSVSSGYIQTMSYSSSGTYAGTFNSGPTVTSLPATLANGGPSAYHAALGSYIVMSLESVSGPAGGSFSFWEGNATAPTFSLATDTTPTSPLWFNLSQGNAAPGEDPYGHVHGRRFSVDIAGTYFVTFRLYDTSTNGPDGGPIHTPSDLFTMRFDAVPEPSTWILIGFAVAVTVFSLIRRRVH